MDPGSALGCLYAIARLLEERGHAPPIQSCVPKGWLKNEANPQNTELGEHQIVDEIKVDGVLRAREEEIRERAVLAVAKIFQGAKRQ